MPTAAEDHELDPDRVGEHLERLSAMARAMCRSHHDAEDLVQDALLAVLRRPRRVRGDDLTYLRYVLRNTFVSTHRRRQSRVTTVALPDAFDEFTAATAPGVEDTVLARELLAHVAALPAPLRDAVIAVDVAGYGCRDAARRLGVREGTIMSRRFRARERLAPLMA